ncbi:hypothetical protein FDH38_gp032 [Dinoroseobacter phage vB_DshS-R5C]|uniref:DinB family protein n=1 Tax=Dinoroseobacter phage vB_DshS-R5C TaxID=1965368 RepID=A0A1V0DY42_9CAUD|nr:hypothetical protein FDH38_gp032 [Dinoroseobacter phage vB_DshS-R5C]ARB06086.1 hypothetical protein vBDshSR5C_32 [Dinoroseobacter phage vB_DshS-R5C]
MERQEMLARFAEKLTGAIAEELEDSARADDRMDSATKAAHFNLAHIMRHAIDHEWIARQTLNKEFD